MIEFTPSDGVLVALGSLLVSVLALIRAGRSAKAVEKLEREKVDVLRRIAGLYDVQADTEPGSATELRALAGRLLTQLLTLPYPKPNDRLIRQAALWSESDLTRLESLAGQVGRTAPDLAAKAVLNLQFLRSTVTRVQSVDARLGYDYKDFPQDRWVGSYDQARSSLEGLAGPHDAENRAARVDVHLTGDRVYLDNVGPAAARDVQLEFHNQQSPLVQGDVDRKLPIPELAAGESCPLIVAISHDCYPPFDVTVSWTDDSCAPGQRRSARKRLYRD